MKPLNNPFSVEMPMMVQYAPRLLLILASLALGSSLTLSMQPPKIDVEFRTDLEWDQSTNKQDINQGKSSLRFMIKRAHLNLKGVFDENLSYHLRARWTHTETDEDETRGDESQTDLEYWYLKQQVRPELAIQVGKQFVFQGGVEGSRNSMDVYQYSLVGERVKDFYEVGVSGFYQVSSRLRGEQFIIGQLFNQSSGSSENQSMPNFNIAWYGNIGQNWIQPVAQYALLNHNQERRIDSSTGDSVPIDSDDAKGTHEMLLSLGAKVHLEEITIEADLLFQTDSASGATSASHIALVRQTEGEVRPFLKAIYDVVDYSKATDRQNISLRNILQAGTEWNPFEQYPAYRVHGVVTYHQVELQRGGYDEYQINVGLSAHFQ